MKIENLIVAIHDEVEDLTNSKAYRDSLMAILEGMTWREDYESVGSMIKELNEEGFY